MSHDTDGLRRVQDALNSDSTHGSGVIDRLERELEEARAVVKAARSAVLPNLDEHGFADCSPAQAFRALERIGAALDDLDSQEEGT